MIALTLSPGWYMICGVAVLVAINIALTVWERRHERNKP